MLLRQSSNLGTNVRTSTFEGNIGDAFEAHDWRCVHIVNGNYHLIVFWCHFLNSYVYGTTIQ